MELPELPGRDDAMRILNKVPEVTLFFWIIKILATTVGETGADFLNINLGLGSTGTSLVMAGLLAGFLSMQLRARAYAAWLYWLNVVLISTAGTLATDTLVDHFGVPLRAAAAAFGLALAATFALWYASERTLSIRTIVTTRRELFYWAAVLFTFALGTAAGDLAAETLHLGYGESALLFVAAISAIVVVCLGFEANAVASFWAAYVLTRPLGACLGDWLSQPVTNGGLGMGAAETSGMFLAAILGLIAFLTAARRDASAQGPDRAGTAREFRNEWVRE